MEQPVKLYGIPNCDKVRAARKWLEQNNLAYSFVNLREDLPDQQHLQQWLNQLGNQQLINRRSTTWKTLGEPARALADTAPAKLLLSQPTLIKRPILESDQHLLCGFTPSVYADTLL